VKVAVADDPAGLLPRPALDEPGHGRTKPVQSAAGDASLELREVAVDGDRLAADRRTAGPE